jgi:tetratricopeptide (TPR) repeat protein
MRCIQPAVLAVAIVAAGLASSPAAAQESNGTPAARAAFDEGETAARAGKFLDAAAAFRKAIDADPDFVDAHQRYIEITQRQEMPGSRTPTVPRLQQLYERWAREQPARAVYQWALGFLSPEADQADVFFKKAIAIDPAFARAYFQLAKNADQRGNWTAQLEYLKKAVDSNRDDPRYLLRYAMAHRRSEPARFRALALQVVDTFPTSPFAAEALYHLAEASSNPERRGYFDRLRANYPFDRFPYSASAMYELYDDLTTPSDALALAREMAAALPAIKTWPARVAFQEAMTRAQALVVEKHFTAASDLLDKTQRPSGNHGMTWTLLKAEAAAGTGHVDQAYATLLDTAAAVPDARVEAALAKYGQAFSKSPQDVDADLWRVRDTKAKIAAPFELPSSRGGAPVKLADYRGKVVLLAFWFPG